MTPQSLRAVGFTLAASLFLLNPCDARATASASGQLSFSNLSITPGTGTLTFPTNWSGSAYAEASAVGQYNTGAASAVANMTGDYSQAHGEAMIFTAGLIRNISCSTGTTSRSPAESLKRARSG